jgi:glycosyltransferase involved in cell wall biosynthesis
MIHKILVIPSWYPTIQSPTIGSFCREQSELVSDCFDSRVIYPKLRVISKKATLQRVFHPNGSKISNNLLGKIPGVELEAEVSSFLSFTHQINFLVGQVRSYLQSMVMEGWAPDIIHAHGTMYGGIVAAGLGRSLHIPVIITEHHSLLVADFDATRWSFYKNAQESADLIVTVSNELKKMILMNGIQCDAIVVGNLIDEDLFRPEEYKDRVGPFRILFIAVPAFAKDIPTFIKALGSVKRSGFTSFEASMIIPEVAADLTREDIVGLCKENGVIENCIILGNTDHELMPGIMNSCDVLVSTSITETFGLSVAEALMCGKPVIVTRSGGVEDFINNKNGILVNIGDYEAISKAIIQLMQGEVKLDTNNSTEEMISRFGKKAFKARICGIYNKLING